MRRPRIVLLVALGLGGAAPAGAPPPDPERGAARWPVAIRAPVVRIGLTTNGVTAAITAAGGVRVVYAADGRPVWREAQRGTLYVVAEAPPGEGPSARYRVQVASFSAEEAAERLAAEVEGLAGEEAEVEFHRDSGVYRVRVGAFADEEAAFALAERLRGLGYGEPWVTEDSPEIRGARLRLVDARYRDRLADAPVLAVLPERAGSPVRVNGSPYRGILEVRIDPFGRLQVVNVVHLEDYLRGVVPGEMGPSVYPQIEALKAQAVAARTYVVGNLGQFRDQGFDICDTPRCQVYGGIDDEHPLTDRAVEETRGLILEHRGRPINALYTSTCGGHTENVEGVFPEQSVAYLRGVPCYPEKLPLVRLRGRRAQAVVRLENGASANAGIAWTRVLGILAESDLDPGFLGAAAAPAEIRTWSDRLLQRIGKPPAPPPDPDSPIRTLGDLNRMLVRDLGWEGRIRLFLRDQDLPHLLPQADAVGLGREDLGRFAYFLHLGILPPFPDNTLRPDHMPSRALVLEILHRIAGSYDSLFLETGKFLGADGDRYRIGSPPEAPRLRVSPEAYLFRRVGDLSLPAEELVLYPGDSLRFHAQEGVIDWLELRGDGPGLSDDRSSPVSRWEVRYSRPDLEKRLQERFPLGRLQDIEIVRTGVSGRVTDLLLHGSRGDFSVRGFRIRTVLGIRETLFVLDRQYGPDGAVQEFIFTGRGWGHGVGLCQVGAFGMALRGETFDRILHHYYSGVKIRKNYGSAFAGS